MAKPSLYYYREFFDDYYWIVDRAAQEKLDAGRSGERLAQEDAHSRQRRTNNADDC